jgi:hypothetical protein
MNEKLTLEEFRALTLKRGSHHSRESGVCVMEAVAWLAGRSHTDAPECVSAPIAAGLRAWNDGLPSDEERNRLLLPIAPLSLGTAADDAIEQRRSLMALDWLIRTWLPTWLDLVPALAVHANAVRALPEMTDANAAAAGIVVRAARAAARDAAGHGAWAAAWDAAWDAAGHGAWDAAWDAAGAAAGAAAWAAAGDAAGAAAGNAARAAARDAAGAAAAEHLRPTVLKLQESAQALFLRMCELKPESLGERHKRAARGEGDTAERNVAREAQP